MKYGKRLSYQEMEDFIFCLKNKIEGTFLKNIYHFQKKWLFKFSFLSLVFDGQTIWNGTFPEREDKNLHSISIKLRKEIGDRKVLSVNLLEGNRILCIEFEYNLLLIECYAKGNIILLEKKSRKILILTRIYESYRHHSIYPEFLFRDFPLSFQPKKYSFFTKEKEVFIKEDGEFPTILEASFYLWNHSQKNQKKRIRKSIEENIQFQKEKWEKKIETVEKEIKDFYQSLEIPYTEIEKKYQEKKKYQKKLEKIKSMSSSSKKIEKKNEKKILEEKWYHKYYWWKTKNNFLVIGGKNSTENEYLVKTYLGEENYFFHTDDFGSGCFILFTEKKKPEEIDFYETSEGVFSLSSYWNKTNQGKVFYVLGSQVSKTPPTGMSLGKGSFFIKGKKEYCSIYQTVLGYGLLENELMLGPYRIIQRLPNPIIKIYPKPNVKKMKGKIISELLKKKLQIDLKNIPYLFSKPCKLS